MSWTNKVVWSEGLFLRPQLFQQMERYLESFTHRRSSPLSPFYWGFSHFRIDTDSLSLGKLVLANAAGVFNDGTPFDTPAQNPPPPPLTLRPEHLEQVIYLAVPIRAPNSEETNFDDAPGSLARFSVFDVDLRDANSIGQGPKPVQLSRLRLRLVPEKELTDGWIGLPIARMTALRSDGSAELDAHLIPPVNGYGASETLTQWFVQLHGTAKLRADALAARLAGTDGKAAEAADVTDYLLLQIVNRYEPLLDHLLKVKETSPEQAYTLLRSMAGELATYVRTKTRRPAVVEDYRHLTPYTSFFGLVKDVQALLNDILIRSAQSIAFELRPHGMRVANVNPATLSGFSSLVLAVSAQMPPDQLAQQFPAQGKVGPSDRLPEQVRLHLPGIPLSALPVPPRQIPFNVGFVYFQIEPRGVLWEHMLKHGGIGLHVAAEFPGLRVELWGVR